MPTITLQFHAAPDEAVALAHDWARKWQLESVVERGRVAMYTRGAGSTTELSDQQPGDQPDCLYLVIGALTKDGLRESALSGEAHDPEAIRKFRAISRAAKAAMHVGAIVRNPMTGATMPLPTQRHTVGAHALAAAGTPILASAGWNVYEFADLARLVT